MKPIKLSSSTAREPFQDHNLCLHGLPLSLRTNLLYTYVSSSTDNSRGNTNRPSVSPGSYELIFTQLAQPQQHTQLWLGLSCPRASVESQARWELHLTAASMKQSKMSQRSACFQLTALSKTMLFELVYFESLSFLNAVTQFYLLFILLFCILICHKWKNKLQQRCTLFITISLFCVYAIQIYSESVRCGS